MSTLGVSYHVIVSPTSSGRPLFYRFAEKGGPTDLPFEASRWSDPDEHYLNALDTARSECPNRSWDLAVLSFNAELLETRAVAALMAKINERVRASALAKLTPRERNVLGLDEVSR